ncbi:hypothetical protein HAX54_044574, partial [Datura stramonium]|nr:hypothetical protein [Datura stramonium]
ILIDKVRRGEVSSFEITEDGVLRFSSRLCIPDIVGLHQQIESDQYVIVKKGIFVGKRYACD